MPQGSEWLIIGIIVILVFGASQLPKLARSLGQAQKEFKKGLNDIKSEVDSATYATPSSSRVAQRYTSDDYDEPTAPKFEPPAQEPVPAAGPTASAENPTAQL